MGTIPTHNIEQIAAANDIVEVIGSYFPLKRAGSSYKALCPFHQEKSPSFNVSPQRQSFHCFGCGAGGSVFRFVMDYEHLDFPSAVRKLAARAGIPVIEEGGSSGTDDRQHETRRTLLQLHAEAAAWFHENLLKREWAAPARDYLKKRGIDRISPLIGKSGSRRCVGRNAEVGARSRISAAGNSAKRSGEAAR
jgi:DNA primase